MKKERLEYINRIDAQLDVVTRGLRFLSDSKCFIGDIVIYDMANLTETNLPIHKAWKKDLLGLIADYYRTKAQELQKEFDKL